MFGINRISWSQMALLLITLLALWYLSLVILAWISHRRHRRIGFEQELFQPGIATAGLPTLVSSADFPTDLISQTLAEAVALPASFYEETGMDDGYPLECFSRANDPRLPEILEKIQVLQ